MPPALRAGGASFWREFTPNTPFFERKFPWKEGTYEHVPRKRRHRGVAPRNAAVYICSTWRDHPAQLQKDLEFNAFRFHHRNSRRHRGRDSPCGNHRRCEAVRDGPREWSADRSRPRPEFDEVSPPQRHSREPRSDPPTGVFPFRHDLLHPNAFPEQSTLAVKAQ